MKNRKKDTRWMALLAMLVAVELVLVATGIGLIPLPVIKATTLHIPVILGAVLLGPLAGGILGAVFGLSSMWINTTAPGLLAFAFSPFMSTTGLPGALKAVWIAVGCRILIGGVRLAVDRPEAGAGERLHRPACGGCSWRHDQHGAGHGQHLFLTGSAVC